MITTFAASTVLFLNSFVPAAGTDLNFPGGDAAGYVQALRMTWPEANIVAGEGMAGVTVPSVVLHDVSLDDAVSVLDGHRAVGLGYMVELDVSARGSAPIYIIEAQIKQGRSGDESSVMSIAHLLDSHTADDIVSAIDATLAVIGTDATTTVRFHEDTSLLLVRGPGSELGTIHRILTELEKTAEHEAYLEHVEGQAAAQVQAQLETALADATAEGDAMRQVMAEMQWRMQSMERDLETLDETRKEAHAYEARMRMIEQEAHLARDQMESRLAESDAMRQDANEHIQVLTRRLEEVKAQRDQIAAEVERLRGGG